ncbi:unnamed protein product [Paramecium sonneborni]|uniref:B box-type domain-containing protein n=1 Tax=Paramecium sonneborni TaxID=65129 RepID=A0A8S1KV80_9CILI|nr:unnamed protein product [Paramecium sonneborni]
MEDLLECTKCGNEVDQILALSCEHNLCLQCSAKLYNKLQCQTLVCEICSSQTLLDPSAIEVLQEMYKLQSSRMSTANLKSSRQQIQYQVSTHSKASQIHINTQQGLTVTCQQHASEEALLYCYTCETPCFCMECYLQGLHKNHEVKNVQKSYSIIRTTKADQFYQKVKSSQDQLLQDQCKFAAKKKELVEINTSTKMQIQSNFQELYKALQLKESELIQVADDTMYEKVKEIDAEVQKIQSQMDKLNDVLSDIESYFPDHPDQSQAIMAFNYIALNNRKIDQLTRTILTERNTWGASLQLQYQLDPQSIIQQIEDIRSTKLKIMSLRALETVEPTINEKKLYERARDDRTKRLFQFQTPIQQIIQDENKENNQSFIANNGEQTQLSEFQRKFQEAKRTLSQRQKLN